MATRGTAIEGADEGRMRRSWRLTRTAFALIGSDSTMIVLTTIAAAFTLVAAAVVFDLGGYFHNPTHTTGHFALVLLIATWPLTFIGTFFNVAMAAAAAARLEGRSLSLDEALQVAAKRVWQIAIWSLLVTGVGILLREIASRLPFAGRLVTWLVGAAWAVVTLFAVPVIALEGCTATGCVHRSAELFKKGWGESVGGTVVVTAIFTLASMPAAIAFGVAGALWRTDRQTALLVLVLALSLLMVISSIANAVRQVFATALYRFATSGDVAGGFDERDLERPFTKKRGLFSRRD